MLRASQVSISMPRPAEANLGGCPRLAPRMTGGVALNRVFADPEDAMGDWEQAGRDFGCWVENGCPGVQPIPHKW